MTTDPRKACANANERLGWAVVHDLVAHPLMAITCWARWALRFHDWTSHHAWPRKADKPTGFYVATYARGLGWLRADEVNSGIWRVQHPTVAHAFVTSADCGYAALVKAEAWFQMLAREFGGRFAPENAA